MSEADDHSRERIKQHFAQRVTHQARLLLEIWQRLQGAEWSPALLAELEQASQKLANSAERFDQAEHLRMAQGIQNALENVRNNRSRLSSETIAELNQLMQRLARTGLRHGDQLEQTSLPPLRRPVYIALSDLEQGHKLAAQLQAFGLNARHLDNRAEFQAAFEERKPAALILDIDFSGPGQALALMEPINNNSETRVPLLLFSDQETDAATRLTGIRSGASDFFIHSLDASTLLERIERFGQINQDDPLQVLVIDDSRAQSTHAEMVLNSAGIITRSINQPLHALDVLDEFQPDLIILDMYMPECLGPELAKVIRQHERYVSIPIIFLSAEDDLDKQLDAMSDGGDDFLTKPIKPRHLIATVRTRAARARSLKARMVRDSLTGLYNHTHTLQLLEDARRRCQKQQQPLCFAMIDIDHFKKVNDTYGHPMGDRVIKSLALFLKQRLRKTDYIGRYGGEEFAIILPDTGLEDAMRVLDGIRRGFAEIHFTTGLKDLLCTFSAGVAQLTEHEEGGQLSKRADEALYVAKHDGRNCVRSDSPQPAATSRPAQ